MPVDIAYTACLAGISDTVDELSPNTVTARGFRREQILHVAGVLNMDQVPVEDEMSQPHQRAAEICGQSVYRFLIRHQALPGGGDNVTIQCCIAFASIEGIVLRPKILPNRAIIVLQGADGNWGCGHWA